MIVYYPVKVYKGKSLLIPKPLEVDEIEHTEVFLDYQLATDTLDGTGFIYQIETEETLSPEIIKVQFKIDTTAHWLVNTETATLLDIYKAGQIVKEHPTEKTIEFKDFLLSALEDNRHTIRHWVMDAFSLKREYPHRGIWDIFPDEPTGLYATFNREGEKVLINTTNLANPCVGFWRALTLNKGDLPNINEPVKTTTGELFSNYSLFLTYFKGHVPYFTGIITPDLVNSVYVQLRKKGVLKDAKALVKALTLGEHLASYCTIAAAGESPKSYVTAPGLRKRRDELLASINLESADQSKLAEATAKLIEINKEWSKGDEVERFNDATKKIQTMVNVKTQIMIGTEDSIGGGRTKVVTTSLEEGARINDLPSLVNGQRSGSEARGKNTAFGGVGIKLTQRILSVYKVSGKDDCGTTQGLTVKVNQFNYKLLIDRYKVGSKTTISADEAKGYIGKTVIIRDPAYCLTAYSNYQPCKTCIGKKAAAKPLAIAVEASNLPSVFQGAMMQAAHGKALEITNVTLDEITS